MKLFAIVLRLFFLSLTCYSQVRVKGYVRKNGTYVRPHIRTSPDGVLWNNYSYRGENSSLSSGSNFTFQNKKYHLGSTSMVTSSESNDANNVNNSRGYTPNSIEKNDSKEPLKDSVKFDNELYFQKLKKIYDKKSAPYK